VGPHRPQQLGGPLQQLSGPKEDHHAPEPVLQATASLHRIQHRGEQRARHEHAGDRFGGDGIQQQVGVEGLVVEQHRPRPPEEVGVQGLEATRPLDRVEVEVDIVLADRWDPGPEGIEVVQVVVDHRRPRPVGLHPGLGLAGGAGGELQETGSVLVHVKVWVFRVAAGLQVGEGSRPVRGVRADRDQVVHADQLPADGVELLGEPGVEDQRRRLDVVERCHVRIHRKVAVEDGPDQVVLLEPKPGLDDLWGVVGEHADPVAALGRRAPAPPTRRGWRPR
jgi:hypothetical protein